MQGRPASTGAADYEGGVCCCLVRPATQRARGRAAGDRQLTRRSALPNRSMT
jgi:hypothetical protein